MQPQSEVTVRQRTTLSSLILLSALFAGSTLCGCAGMADPRVDRPLDTARLEATPAFQDASRAWPIAFHAAPDTQGRFELTVDGQRHVLLVSNWVHQLAATLNHTLDSRSLYDRRAAVVARKALLREVIDGRVHTGITDRARHDREVRLSAGIACAKRARPATRPPTRCPRRAPAPRPSSWVYASSAANSRG